MVVSHTFPITDVMEILGSLPFLGMGIFLSSFRSAGIVFDSAILLRMLYSTGVIASCANFRCSAVTPWLSAAFPLLRLVIAFFRGDATWRGCGFVEADIYKTHISCGSVKEFLRENILMLGLYKAGKVLPPCLALFYRVCDFFFNCEYVGLLFRFSSLSVYE